MGLDDDDDDDEAVVTVAEPVDDFRAAELTRLEEEAGALAAEVKPLRLPDPEEGGLERMEPDALLEVPRLETFEGGARSPLMLDLIPTGFWARPPLAESFLELTLAISFLILQSEVN